MISVQKTFEIVTVFIKWGRSDIHWHNCPIKQINQTNKDHHEINIIANNYAWKWFKHCLHELSINVQPYNHSTANFLINNAMDTSPYVTYKSHLSECRIPNCSTLINPRGEALQRTRKPVRMIKKFALFIIIFLLWRISIFLYNNNQYFHRNNWSFSCFTPLETIYSI